MSSELTWLLKEWHKYVTHINEQFSEEFRRASLANGVLEQEARKAGLSSVLVGTYPSKQKPTFENFMTWLSQKEESKSLTMLEAIDAQASTKEA